MISPISLPSIYKPQVIAIFPKKWVEAIPVVWYINGEFFQSKGIVVPTNHHPFHLRPNSSWDGVARRMWSYPLLSSIFGRNEPGYAYLGTETRVSNENGVSDIRKFTKQASMHSLGLLGWWCLLGKMTQGGFYCSYSTPNTNCPTRGRHFLRIIWLLEYRLSAYFCAEWTTSLRAVIAA